ncbi:MAG: hypothetical protein K2Y28_07745 [Burkholderiaceae bacterium]|nr:hypothetical protein [Burkholderiaceae bacterium]
MNFIELTTGHGQKYLFDVESGWEIYDYDAKNQPALWSNAKEARNIPCRESYAEVRARLMPEPEPKRPAMRRVEVLRYFRANPEKKIFASGYEKDYEAWFHQFGLYSDENTDPYSVAIVEKDDGSVDSVSVHLIRFIGAA